MMFDVWSHPPDRNCGECLPRMQKKCADFTQSPSAIPRPHPRAVTVSLAAVLVHVLSGRRDLTLVTTALQKSAYRGTRIFFAAGVTNGERFVLLKVAIPGHAA